MLPTPLSISCHRYDDGRAHAYVAPTPRASRCCSNAASRPSTTAASKENRNVRARDPLRLRSARTGLDDADAQIASQQGQIDQAQETGVDIVASAQAAYDDLSAQLGAAQEDASQAADEAAEAQDQAEQAAAEAEGTADEVQKEADAAEAKAETATCAQSFVSAFGLIFSGATLQEGVDAAVAELQALQPQCAPALG